MGSNQSRMARDDVRVSKVFEWETLQVKSPVLVKVPLSKIEIPGDVSPPNVSWREMCRQHGVRRCRGVAGRLVLIFGLSHGRTFVHSMSFVACKYDVQLVVVYAWVFEEEHRHFWSSLHECAVQGDDFSVKWECFISACLRNRTRAPDMCCWACGASLMTKKRYTCSRCEVARYCSVQCQTEDWRNFHKSHCVAAAGFVNARQATAPPARNRSDAT